MTPAYAAALLNLPTESPGDLLALAVTQAFRVVVKQRGVDANIQDLQEARQVLLDVIGERDNACTWCHGVGMIRGRMGMRACAACRGTGDKR